MSIQTVPIPDVTTACIRCGRETTRAVVSVRAVTWWCGRCQEEKP